MNLRNWMLVIVGGVLGLSILAASATADGEKASILKIADLLEKGKDAEAKKMASGLKDADLEEVMNLMLPRKKTGKSSGIGIGPKPGAITPDGIEKKLQSLEKTAPKPAEFEALEKAGYVMRAIALVAPIKEPTGKKGKWKKYSEDYDKTAADFIEAVKKKDAKAIQASSIKLNNACVNCHNDYKKT